MGLLYTAVISFGLGCAFGSIVGGDATVAFHIAAITWIYVVVAGGLLFLYRS